MTFKAKALLVTPLGVHFEFEVAPAIVDISTGKTYLVTIAEDVPTPAPEPEPQKPFAASVVTTQNPWIEG